MHFTLILATINIDSSQNLHTLYSRSEGIKLSKLENTKQLTQTASCPLAQQAHAYSEPKITINAKHCRFIPE